MSLEQKIDALTTVTTRLIDFLEANLASLPVQKKELDAAKEVAKQEKAEKAAETKKDAVKEPAKEEKTEAKKGPGRPKKEQESIFSNADKLAKIRDGVGELDKEEKDSLYAKFGINCVKLPSDPEKAKRAKVLKEADYDRFLTALEDIKGRADDDIGDEEMDEDDE